MQITVLGKYSLFPPANGATSGYLITQGNSHVLIGCGSGVLSRMQRFVPIANLSALVLTNLSASNTADVMVLRHALTNMQSRAALPGGPLKVIMPNAPRSEYNMLVSGQNVLEVFDFADGMSAQWGDLKITLHNMRYPTTSFGIRAHGSGKTFAFTGDTGVHNGLIPFADGADLFLCDAAFLDRDQSKSKGTHLTAKQAGVIAKEANVKRLLCTNLQPFASEDEIRIEASRNFRIAETAQEMRTYFS